MLCVELLVAGGALSNENNNENIENNENSNNSNNNDNKNKNENNNKLQTVMNSIHQSNVSNLIVNALKSGYNHWKIHELKNEDIENITLNCCNLKERIPLALTKLILSYFVLFD